MLYHRTGRLEELYCQLGGAASMCGGGERFDVVQGTIGRVTPKTNREVVNDSGSERGWLSS